MARVSSGVSILKTSLYLRSTAEDSDYIIQSSPVRMTRKIMWERGEVLGRGAFAVVFLAKSLRPDDDHEDLFAVKSTLLQRSGTLQKERLILRQFADCDEIIRCYGEDMTFDNQKNVYNLILEYAPGGSLLDLINGDGPIPESDVRVYARMILRGLAALHAKGYVHCDLKPDNILVFPSDDGKIKLKITDFGLAKDCREEEERGERLTFRGASYFMSPESVLDGEIGPALDIWSLGCVLLTMLTGRFPWKSPENSKELISEITSYDGTPNVPESLSELGKDFLRRVLDRKHKERWTARMLLTHPFVSSDPPLPS